MAVPTHHHHNMQLLVTG